MDERICPLCQQPNLCGNLPASAGAASCPPATPTTGFDCWCRHQPVSAVALERLAPEQRGLACICQACASAAAPPS